MSVRVLASLFVGIVIFGMNMLISVAVLDSRNAIVLMLTNSAAIILTSLALFVMGLAHQDFQAIEAHAQKHDREEGSSNA